MKICKTFGVLKWIVYKAVPGLFTKTLYYVKFAVVRGSTWVSRIFTPEPPFDIYIKIRFMESSVEVCPKMFKWWPSVDLDIFYGKVKITFQVYSKDKFDSGLFTHVSDSGSRDPLVYFTESTPKVVFSLVASPFVKILLLECSRRNKNRYHTEKVKYPLYIKKGIIRSNFNGSNTFGTMNISSRQVLFEPMRVDESARSGGIIVISLISYNMKVCCVSH